MQCPKPTSRSHGAQPPSFYIWHVPGKSCTIHLSLNAVDHLNDSVTEAFKSVPRRGLETGGLLLGRIDSSNGLKVIVEDFEAVDSEHRRGPSYTLSAKDKGLLEETISRRKDSVVGFYRSHTRPGLFLDEEDFGLLKEHFADPSCVFLLVKPSASPTDGVAGFFFWEDGDIHRQSSYLQFPFHRKQLEAGGFKISRSEVSAPPEVLPAEPFLAYSRPKYRAEQTPLPESKVPMQPRWLWVAAAILLLVAGLGYRKVSARFAAKSEPARATLSLNVARDGQALRLRWDRNTPVIRKADRALLSIADGGQHKVLDLDARQLRTGSIAYWPASEDVDFNLEVFSASQRASESIRIVAQTPASARTQPPAPPSVLARKRAERAAPVEEVKEDLAAEPRPSPFAPVEQVPTAWAARPATGDPKTDPASTPDMKAKSQPLDALREPEPPRHAPEPVVTVTYEPARVSKLRRVISRVPVVDMFQRHKLKQGPRFVSAKPVHQVSPVLPPKSRRWLTGEAWVNLKVSIDKSGRVSQTELQNDADGNLAYVAMDAAKRWQFTPARLNDQVVSSEMILHFVFKNPPVSTMASR
jgi:hypothetical protein